MGRPHILGNESVSSPMSAMETILTNDCFAVDSLSSESNNSEVQPAIDGFFHLLGIGQLNASKDTDVRVESYGITNLFR